MKISKQVISTALTLALAATLTVSSNAHAVPGFTKMAPMSSIDSCVSQISENANYNDAGRVRHNVQSRPHRIASHTISVDTTVFGSDGVEIIREYATVCKITNDNETKHFAIEEKSI